MNQQIQNMRNEEQIKVELVQELTNNEQVQELTNNEEVQEKLNQEQPSLPESVPIQRSSLFDLPDDEFVNLYRLTKPVALRVIELVGPYVEARLRKKNSIPVDWKVLCALRFYGTGVEQRVLSEGSKFPIRQHSVSKIILQVTDALNRLLKICVKFPRERGIQETIKNGFYEYCGLTGVLGAVGCTHVALQSPKEDGYHQKKNYLNSKNFYSLKVQLVCDSKLKILDVVASSPGGTDDAYIWRTCNLRRTISQGRVIRENSWLIGDSSYPDEPWLKTPVLLVTSAEDVSFNSLHSKGMNIIKELNGTLKSRFQCLKKENMLRYDPVTACKIINACVVLHNICVKNELVWSHEPLDDDDNIFDTASAQDKVITEFLTFL